MSFVTIPGLVTAESTDTTAETAEVQIPSAQVPRAPPSTTLSSSARVRPATRLRSTRPAPASPPSCWPVSWLRVAR